jgi:hypothetical protein
VLYHFLAALRRRHNQIMADRKRSPPCSSTPSSSRSSSRSRRFKRTNPSNFTTTSDEATSEDQNSDVAYYQWKLPTEVNPAEGDASFCDLLENNVFIDKSAILYYLLKQYFGSLTGDFRSVTLHLVYPRRFAKTTLLGFIEALFSPVARLDDDNMETVREKIASLECGKQLLAFRLHPVIALDMLGFLLLRT